MKTTSKAKLKITVHSQFEKYDPAYLGLLPLIFLKKKTNHGLVLDASKAAAYISWLYSNKVT